MGSREDSRKIVSAADDVDVAAELAHTFEPGGNCVRLTAGDNAWPQQTAYLTPAAARLLARYLLELADDAELLNLHDESDVEMACTVCRKPVRRSFAASTWQHREAADALACTAAGPLKARVAAGA